VDRPRNLQQGDGGSHYNDEGEYDRDVAVFMHGKNFLGVAGTTNRWQECSGPAVRPYTSQIQTIQQEQVRRQPKLWAAG